MERYYTKEADALDEEQESRVQDFTDITELWTAVSLYVNAGYTLVSDLPETQLRYIFYFKLQLSNSSVLVNGFFLF